jgi:hypothetical protein
MEDQAFPPLAEWISEDGFPHLNADADRITEGQMVLKVIGSGGGNSVVECRLPKMAID